MDNWLIIIATVTLVAICVVVLLVLDAKEKGGKQ
jgi:hypothetical protein